MEYFTPRKPCLIAASMAPVASSRSTTFQGYMLLLLGCLGCLALLVELSATLGRTAAAASATASTAAHSHHGATAEHGEHSEDHMEHMDHMEHKEQKEQNEHGDGDHDTPMQDRKFCSGMPMVMGNMQGFSREACVVLFFASWELTSAGRMSLATGGVLLLTLAYEWLRSIERELYQAAPRSKMLPGGVDEGRALRSSFWHYFRSFKQGECRICP